MTRATLLLTILLLPGCVPFLIGAAAGGAALGAYDVAAARGDIGVELANQLHPADPHVCRAVAPMVAGDAR